MVRVHAVPAMLILLYAIPAAFGLYAFQDRYAVLVLACLGASVLFYYAGYVAADRIGPLAGARLSVAGRLLDPGSLERAALATLVVYGLLVVYLAATSTSVALLVALRLGGASDIAAAREAYVQNRAGWEVALRYCNAILLRVAVPCAVLYLYSRGSRWRHWALFGALLGALVSLEKSLTAFLLVPLAVYFLLAGRTRAIVAMVLAVVFVGAATVLGTGLLPELAGRGKGADVKLVTELQGDRKNLFWVLQWISIVSPGGTLHEAVKSNSAPLLVSPQGILLPTDTDKKELDRTTAVQSTPLNRPPTSVAADSDPAKTPQPKGAESVPAIRRDPKVLAPALTRAISVPEIGAQRWAKMELRNRIVNGDMGIDDVNGGIRILPASNAYALNRWLAPISVGKLIATEQVTDAPDEFSRSLKVSVATSFVPAGGDVFEIQQRLEGFKVSDLHFGTSEAKNVNLSFWVKASIPGNYNVTLVNGRWTRSFLSTYTIKRADQWERKSLAIPGDKFGGEELWPAKRQEAMVLSFNLGAGSAYQTSQVGQWADGFFRQSSSNAVALVTNAAATWQVTGVQFEVGSRPTDFERRPADVEASLSKSPREHSIAEQVLRGLMSPKIEMAFDVLLVDSRFIALLQRTGFIVNRVAWIPYITAYDWFRFQDEALGGHYQLGRTVGVLAWLRGLDRYPAEHEVFKYQFGVYAVPTATANAAYFADAYLNFGWLGVVLYSFLIGIIFRIIANSGSLPLISVSVMSAFGLMVASFPANLFSGALALLLLLALLARDAEVGVA